MEAEWPLVGRDGELRRLREAITATDHRGVVIAGAPGLGKTRLAAEGLRIAEDLGMTTLRATATLAAQAIPFGALAPLLPPDQPGTTADRTDLLRRATASLAEHGRSGRAVLLVDDAHLLDDASATLVHQLALTGTVFLLVTVRAVEKAPDSVVGLWKDGLLERLDLAGLSETSVRDLLAAVLGGQLDHAAPIELARHCEGNALFLRELVRGAMQSGTLQHDGHMWRFVSPVSPSDRLVELVEARLSGLTGAERAFLEVVAIGEPLGEAELDALGDADVAEQLEDKTLITTARNGRRLEVRLAHTIYGDVLRARMSPLRAAKASRTLAEVVESRGARRREDTLRVATWRLDGGGGSAQLMIEAAGVARWRYDFALAERLADQAVTAGGGFEALFLAAQLAGLRNRPERAEALMRQAEPETDDQHGRALIWLFDHVAFHLGDIERGLRIATDAERLLTEPRWLHRFAVRRASLLLATGGPRAAAEAAEPLLTQAEGPTLVWACQTAAYNLCRLGRLDAALAANERGQATQRDLREALDWYPLAWHPWVQLFNTCEIHVFAGRLVEAEAIAREQYQEALAARSVEAQAWFARVLCRVLGQRGQVETATRFGREAAALFTDLGQPQFVAFSLANLIPSLAATGDRALTAEAIGELRSVQTAGNLMMATEMRLAEAWGRVVDGEPHQARHLLEETIELSREIGDIVIQVTALHDLCRIGYADAAAHQLELIASNVDGYLVTTKVRHGVALASSDAADLDEVAAEFERMGANLLAAEAASDAAVAWRRTGDVQPSNRAARLAAAFSGRCEGAVTPALQALSARATLTPAERQVAVLAAAGRTTKTIAEELQLSTRTVSNYLQRAYQKLGINGRDELAGCFAPDDLRSPWPVRPPGRA